MVFLGPQVQIHRESAPLRRLAPGLYTPEARAEGIRAP